MATKSTEPHYNPWIPMSSPRDLKTILKLGEETCELGAAICRCAIQGVDEAQPVTGKINRDWLEDELADVVINAKLVIEHFGLDNAKIEARALSKEAGLRWWHSGAARG